ncbi:MAG: YjbH domain-containing protein [Proteobacteria bacterium]|nr:YjbH domain-containing protein [Pseudomonadota bacterium]
MHPPTVYPRRPAVFHPLALVLAAVLPVLLQPHRAQAQQSGLAAVGASGGLVVPDAQVLPSGTVGATRSNYAEPQLGNYSKLQNYTLGVGLLPNLELFGRFAEYQNPRPGSTFISGIRDISANVKLKLPEFWRGQPDIAVGINDIRGGASFFKSRYVVADGFWGPVRLSAGYAWGGAIPGNAAGERAFDGPFGGVEWRVANTGLSALAEYDGRQKHVGVRYTSPPLAALGHAQLVGTVQRSLGATDPAGRDADRTSVAVSVVVPFGGNEERRQHFKPEMQLTSLDAKPAAPGGMVATAEDRLDSLQKALVATGLERVRTGTQGSNLIVEYENNRYAQNEADAIGLVLGLAAEYAPASIRRVAAVTLKAGQRMYETSVDVAIYRAFLRDGDAANARTSLAVDRLPGYNAADVRWVKAEPARRTPVRIEIKPELEFIGGTEVGTFDYSLAANVQAFVPLWRGAELYTSYIERLSNSDNFEPGFAFGAFRKRNGLKVAAVQQTFWLGQHIHANVGVGRYNYDAWGVQGEATVFVPGRDDVIRLRGGAYERQPGQNRRQTAPASATYRWVPQPNTWVEAGLQQYSDGFRGPSLVLTRWFGDVGVHLFYRRSGDAQFAGLELSVPLTPRQGMAPGLVQLGGTSRFAQGVRTRLVDSSTGINFVQPSAALDMQLNYNAEQRQLNSGRSSQRYFVGQLHRMREAFYLYARRQLPQ